jgi:hypothetical protein
VRIVQEVQALAHRPLSYVVGQGANNISQNENGVECAIATLVYSRGGIPTPAKRFGFARTSSFRVRSIRL